MIRFFLICFPGYMPVVRIIHRMRNVYRHSVNDTIIHERRRHLSIRSSEKAPFVSLQKGPLTAGSCGISYGFMIGISIVMSDSGYVEHGWM